MNDDTGVSPVPESLARARRPCHRIMLKPERLYGFVAEFDGPESLVEAARRAHQAGYTRKDAYAPFPTGDPGAYALVGMGAFE